MCQGLENDSHGSVEEPLRPRLAFAFSELLAANLGDREVAKENTGVLRWFAANGAGNVTEGEVYRICRLVPGELSQLRLVRGDNHWRNSSAFW